MVIGLPAQGFSSGQSMALMEQIAAKTLPPGTGFEWTAMSAVAWMFWLKVEDRGRPRFFADQTYNFGPFGLWVMCLISEGTPEKRVRPLLGSSPATRRAGMRHGRRPAIALANRTNVQIGRSAEPIWCPPAYE